MKTFEFGAMKGVRNDISPERFKLGDLSVGTNIDIDDTGKVWRREGTTNVASGNMHSLYNNGTTTLVVDGGNLTMLDDAWNKFVLAAVVGGRVDYTTINEAIYWSDELASGVVSQGANRQWGVTPPPGVGATAAVGDFAAGTYLMAVTYVRYDGHESGSSNPVAVTLDDNQGLALTLIPSTNPLVEHQRLYLSGINGEVCFLAAEYPNSQQSAVVTNLSNTGPALRTAFHGPLPAGQLVGYFAGRAYVAKGPYLWYSLPYEYELCDLRTGYIGFDTTVNTFSPVVDGIFVGTAKSIHWLEGTDPTTFKREQRASFGSVRGTEALVPGYLFGEEDEEGNTKVQAEDVQTFMTARGVCAGFNGGTFKNVTGGRYFPVEASEGSSLLKVRGGTPLLTTTLFK